MALNKNIKVFLVFLALFVVVSFMNTLLASYGVSDSMLPALPYIGTLPVIGAGIAFLLWKFYLKKEL